MFSILPDDMPSFKGIKACIFRPYSQGIHYLNKYGKAEQTNHLSMIGPPYGSLYSIILKNFMLWQIRTQF